MAQTLQAKCPGCQTVLRIPPEWLNQTIRCKKCGVTVQAKQTAPAPATAVQRDRTPPPAPRRLPPPPAAPRLPAPPTPTPTPVARPQPPMNVQMAVPVSAPPTALTQQAPSGSSFAFEEHEDEEPRPTRRRPAKRSGSGVGGLIALGVVVLLVAGLGGTAFAFRAELKGLFTGNLQVADSEDEDGDESDVASTTENGSSSGKAPAPRAKGKGKAKATGAFPRRALVISVHNYLYANPQPEGGADTINTQRLIRTMSDKLRIPVNQITHLSDSSKVNARPPLETIIRQGVENFLKTTRKQDRILVLFLGHVVEANDKAYLAPLEGELKEANTMVPLDWLMDQLKKCEARQKVLVIEGNRFNAAQGEERPGAGPMGAKVEEMLKSPPAGVQVLASCSKEQIAHEFEGVPIGAFLNAFRRALTPETGFTCALEGKIQTPDDLIPVDELHAALTKNLTEELRRRSGSDAKDKLTQTPILAGKAPASGADYDPSEPAAQAPAMPSIQTANQAMLREVMAEISLPPIKGGEFNSSDVDFSMLPAFSEEAMRPYADRQLPPDSRLKAAIEKARITLWSISTARPPLDITAVVDAQRKTTLDLLRDRYNKPTGDPAEKALKTQIENDSRGMARIVARLDSVIDDLKEAKEAELDGAPMRWKANFAYVYGRIHAQQAYLEEYQGLLGSMRKELPPSEAFHSGWRMSSKLKTGDSAAKKLEKTAQNSYKTLLSEHKGTPWEVLAKREKLTTLGLEWAAY